MAPWSGPPLAALLGRGAVSGRGGRRGGGRRGGQRPRRLRSAIAADGRAGLLVRRRARPSLRERRRPGLRLRRPRSGASRSPRQPHGCDRRRRSRPVWRL